MPAWAHPGRLAGLDPAAPGGPDGGRDGGHGRPPRGARAGGARRGGGDGVAWRVTAPAAAAAPIPAAAARQYLDRAVAAALAPDEEALCALNGARLNCLTMLDDGARRRWPDTAPATVAARYVRESDQDNTGWVFTVAGTDGAGEAYTTEVFVFRSEGALTAINIVWWSGARLVLEDDGTSVESPV